MDSVHKQLVAAFYEEFWNRGDPSKLQERLTPDFLFRGSLGHERRGPEEFWDYVQLVRGALDRYRCETIRAVAEGEHVFARMVFSGVHRGELLGFPPTGKHVSWDGAALFTVRDGRIAELWVLGDLWGLRAQLEAGA